MSDLIHDDITPHLALPLPHPANDLAVDVLRLRDALSDIDGKFAGLDALLQSDDLDMDQLQELVNAIKANASDVIELLASKATRTELEAVIADKASRTELATAVAGVLPGDAGQEGKLFAVRNGVRGWHDPWGEPIRVTGDAILALRRRHHIDTSAPRALLMPPGAVHGDWLITVDVKLRASANNVTLDGNGKPMPGGDPSYVMDKDGESILWVCDEVEGWVRG
jgi:hypothetical protein